jgi:hypothetical protein
MNYLKDTIPEKDLKTMISNKRKSKGKKTKKKKYKISSNKKGYKSKQLRLGEQKLFNKLTNLNNDMYQQVYEETQKKFSSSKRKKSS